MKLLYTGKTKDVYQYNQDLCLLKFKDDVTGQNGVFDPGANQVGLKIEGMGHSGLRVSTYFFEILKSKGVKTHYISSDLKENTMIVHQVKPFGHGLEVICRYQAMGSFVRRYGLYVKEGQDLGQFVEFTLKDDLRQDPLITKEGLLVLNILKEGEYEVLVDLTKQICDHIKNELLKHNCQLVDIKLEFGRLCNGEIVLMDELSAGNMRVLYEGKTIKPLQLEQILSPSITATLGV